MCKSSEAATWLAAWIWVWEGSGKGQGWRKTYSICFYTLHNTSEQVLLKVTRNILLTQGEKEDLNDTITSQHSRNRDIFSISCLSQINKHARLSFTWG